MEMLDVGIWSAEWHCSSKSREKKVSSRALT